METTQRGFLLVPGSGNKVQHDRDVIVDEAGLCKGHLQWQCLRWSIQETEKARPRLEAYPTMLCCLARPVPKVLLPSKTVRSAADHVFKLVTLWGTFPIRPATALFIAC